MPHFPCAYRDSFRSRHADAFAVAAPGWGVSRAGLPPPEAEGTHPALAGSTASSWLGAGKGTCAPVLQLLSAPDPTACASQCINDDHSYAIAFSYDGGRCYCCEGLALDPGSPAVSYARAAPLWQFLGVGTSCSSPALSSPSTPLNACALVCGIDQWLLYRGAGPSQACDCCATANLVDSGSPDHFVYYSKVPGWVYVGLGSCDADPIYTTPSASGPNQCANECSTKPAATGFYYVVGSQLCHCCSRVRVGANPDPTIVPGYVYVRDVRDNGGGVYGDPHITALDGSHYLLLNQGTFSLWHLHGLLTEFQTQDGFKKVPVEWEIFTHYSGHQSFTKGLVLVDRSAGLQRQVLEITSQDCQWRARSGAEWTMVNKPGMISVGQDYVTGFNVTKTNGRKHRGPSRNQLKLNQVHLSMNSKDGATDIAVLTVSCRPKRNLNLNLVMKRRSDHGFVEGELAGGKKLAALETDSEFNIKGKWQDLGGSDQAAAYLRQMDEDSSLHVSLLQSCTAEDKVQAKITCSKYLDSLEHLDPAGFFLNDCVYDVCHGAGEVAAELAAELLTSASV